MVQINNMEFIYQWWREIFTSYFMKNYARKRGNFRTLLYFLPYKYAKNSFDTLIWRLIEHISEEKRAAKISFMILTWIWTPDTWSRPIWDLLLFYLLRPIFFQNFLRYFFRSMHFEHPSIPSRFFLNTHIVKIKFQ